MLGMGTRGGRGLQWVAAILLFGLVGCQPLIPGSTPWPFYQSFQPIDDAETCAFVSDAQAQLTASYGKPVVPVQRVSVVDTTRPFPEARHYTQVINVRLDTYTVCEDAAQGEFIIYVSRGTDERYFFPLLGHECFHLLNANLTDWYVEGMATLFSEEFCRNRGKGADWERWSKKFLHGKKDPYEASYRMMKQLRDAVPEAYPRILAFAVPAEQAEGWQRIDIDAWLHSLQPSKRQQALQIIAQYSKVLKAHHKGRYSFTVPQ